MQSSSKAQDTAGPRGFWLDTIRLGLWSGFLLGLLRLAVLFAMESLAHGADPAQVRVRLAQISPLVVASLVGAGLLVAIVFAGVASTSDGRIKRWLFAPLAVVGAGSLFLTLLSGWGSHDHSRMVGWDTDRGRQVVLALSALSIAAAMLLMWLCKRALTSTANASPRSILFVLAIVCGLPLGAQRWFGSYQERMSVRSVLHEFAVGPPAWLTLTARADGAPFQAVLCPSIDYKLNGADMPALVLPPPAEVELQIDSSHLRSGRVELVGRIGVDRLMLENYEQELRGLRVRFEVFLDDQLTFQSEIELERKGRWPGSEWRELGEGGHGLRLQPETQVRLRTSLRTSEGKEAEVPWPLLAGFGGLRLQSEFQEERQNSSPTNPNIVLILMDTQRADRLGCYGYGRPTSPHIDRLARRGTLFEQAHSTSSWTWPSTASVLTGMLPQEHGVQDEFACFLSMGLDTLPEALQREGYTTAAWTANPLIVPDKNFDQGFEFFDFNKGSIRESAVVVPPALEWIDSMAGRKFFLYLHLTDPHVPFLPLAEGKRLLANEVPGDFSPKALADYSKRFRGNEGHTADGVAITDQIAAPEHQEWLSDMYDACVWSGDYWVGRVLDRIEQLGLEGETIVVFTSDHGEELFEHGMVAHGQSLFSELVNVPLILAGPGIPKGARIETPVSNRHLGGTLARLGGGSLRALEGGLDLLRAGDQLKDQSILFSTRHGWWNGVHPLEILGLRTADWVLHYAPEGLDWDSESGDTKRLFELGRDPFQKESLERAFPDQATRLQSELIQQVELLEARHAAPDIAAGESTLEFLRNIGYIGDE